MVITQGKEDHFQVQRLYTVNIKININLKGFPWSVIHNKYIKRKISPSSLSYLPVFEIIVRDGCSVLLKHSDRRENRFPSHTGVRSSSSRHTISPVGLCFVWALCCLLQ